MRNKRKAVSSKTAKGMPTKGFHPLDTLRSVAHQHISSTSDGVLGESNVGYSHPNVANHVGSTSNSITGASGSSHSNVSLTDAHHALTPALQAPIQSHQEFGVAAVSPMF